MKRNLIAGLALTLLASTSAFAQGGGGIGRAGTYNQPWWSQGSVTTRAQVRAETAESHGYVSQASLSKSSEGGVAAQGVESGAANGANGQ